MRKDSLIPEKISRLKLHLGSLKHYAEREETKIQVEMAIHHHLTKIIAEIEQIIEEMGREYRND